MNDVDVKHKWRKPQKHSLTQRCNICGCNRVKTCYPLYYVYYYDSNLSPIKEKPNCDAYMNNLKSNLNKLTW